MLVHDFFNNFTIFIKSCQITSTKQFTFFFFFLDFEAIIDSTTGEHVPIIYSFVIIDSMGVILKEECLLDRTGEAHIKFVKRLLDLENNLLKQANRYKYMPSMSASEKMWLRNTARNCSHCHEAFLPDQIRTIDHCHYSGDILGICHQSCNLQRGKKMQRKSIVCFAHNAK